jgi:hypothetical protein
MSDMPQPHGTTSEQLYSRMLAGGCGKAPVARQERCVKRLGQCDIGGVIGREVAPQIPDARQKEIMRIPPQCEVGEVRQSQAAAFNTDISIRGVAPDDLRDLDIEQMRRVERLTRSEEPILHRFRRRRAEKGLEQRRRVDNDHPRSRSIRTASAGDMDAAISVRLRKRARNSSIVGLSAI